MKCIKVSVNMYSSERWLRSEVDGCYWLEPQSEQGTQRRFDSQCLGKVSLHTCLTCCAVLYMAKQCNVHVIRISRSFIYNKLSYIAKPFNRRHRGIINVLLELLSSYLA